METSTPSTQPAASTVQQPPDRRSRIPNRPVPIASCSGPSSPSALLELTAAYPFYTKQICSINYFDPDSQMLFHVLGIFDQMMNYTHSFLESSPAWLPIVSQLYISLLWNVMIFLVNVESGHGTLHSGLLNDLISHLQINECMIPGPLAPFFQALTSVDGPFDWIGDIITAMPNFAALWNSQSFHPTDDYARQLPIPAIILNQLHYFSQWAIPSDQTSSYSHYEWYRNVFSQGTGTYNRLNRTGPQLCGSLFTTQNQYEAAHTFWNSSLYTGITRTNAAEAGFTDFSQLLGFRSQNGSIQLNWFQQVNFKMQKYAKYFKDSAPLRSIHTVGIGAGAIRGIPLSNTAVRDWLYPDNAGIEPFKTDCFAPRGEIPAQLVVNFEHAHHGIEEQAEKYAMVTHTNMQWSFTNLTMQNGWTTTSGNRIHEGDYWRMMSFRFSNPVRLKIQFAQLIASRYHQDSDNGDD